MSAYNQDKPTMRQVVPSSKQPAKADPIENMTSQTVKAPKMPRWKALTLDTLNYNVLSSSQLDFTILARLERETCDMMFQLLQMAKIVSIPKHKGVAAGPRPNK